MNEQDQYVIAWVSRVTGDEGRGTQAFPKKDAEQIAADANERVPELPNAAVRAPETREE